MYFGLYVPWAVDRHFAHSTADRWPIRWVVFCDRLLWTRFNDAKTE